MSSLTRARALSQIGCLYKSRWRKVFWCLYCGEAADTRDHVWPISMAADMDWMDRHIHPRIRRMLITVPCCSECNSLARDYIANSFREKRRHIQNLLRKKYAKILSSPDWSEEELSELGPSLRSAVEAGVASRRKLLRRLSWPRGKI